MVGDNVGIRVGEVLGAAVGILMDPVVIYLAVSEPVGDLVE